MNVVHLPQSIRSGVLSMLLLSCCGGAQAAVIDAELESEMETHDIGYEVPVIVTLSDKVDHRQFEVKDRRHRDNRLFKALKDKSAITQAEHKAFLQSRGGHGMRELWSINGIAVTARVEVIREMAAHAGVENIRADSLLQAPVVSYGSPAQPQWNLGAVHAPDLWALNHTGAGVVVANMDTGVDANHPDLATKWRGGSNSWYDPHGEHATPFDSMGHGTQTMGVMVGGDISGTSIGVAPGATWIAAKLYNDAGLARFSDIHLAFQWLLDPDGNPATVDAPDVVNASWGLVGATGQCITEFSADIAALKAAGIAVTFAGGNNGAAPLSSISPANDAQAFASGAVDALLAIAPFSSRGPSACDGSVFPKVVAPGVNINTADLSSGGLPLYTTVSGTSYAAPHTAGVMALLINAFPNATVAELEAALMQSAQDLGVAGPDNSYGYGLADALAAYRMLLGGTGGGQPAISSSAVTVAVQGLPYVYAVQASDPNGSAILYSLDVAPAGMAIDAATGVISWTPGYAQEGVAAVTVRVANDRGFAVTQTFNVAITRTNVAPLAVSDSYSVIKGSTLAETTAGVLGNDSDPNLDPLVALPLTMPANGNLALNTDGTFCYTPNAGYTGTDSFSYRAYDGLLYSSEATVTVTVSANQPPVARNDSVLVSRSMTTYAPKVISVLANDFDPDGSPNPASVVIVTRPSKGGTLVVNANGTVAYTPQPNFRGIEVFQYQMTDNLGAYSNRANVWVNVY